MCLNKLQKELKDVLKEEVELSTIFGESHVFIE
jgi:hypothetical protein